MIKKIINHLKSLHMDLTPWMDNHFHCIKEKMYKGRKIIIIIEKNRMDNYIGKFMIMNYKKQLVIDENEIGWNYSPFLTYKTEILYRAPNKNTTVEDTKEHMEKLFQDIFIEKKQKIKFMK
jgi:hypothetical protein